MLNAFSDDIDTNLNNIKYNVEVPEKRKVNKNANRNTMPWLTSKVLESETE